MTEIHCLYLNPLLWTSKEFSYQYQLKKGSQWQPQLFEWVCPKLYICPFLCWIFLKVIKLNYSRGVYFKNSWIDTEQLKQLLGESNLNFYLRLWILLTIFVWIYFIIELYGLITYELFFLDFRGFFFSLDVSCPELLGWVG